MQLYLLYDSGCGMCNTLAHEIEQVVDGRLITRSLCDPEMQALLNQVQPRWQWEPTLLEVQGEQRVRVFTGLQMRLRLAISLGARRTWRVLQIIHRFSISSPNSEGSANSERRAFLKRATTLIAAVGFMPR